MKKGTYGNIAKIIFLVAISAKFSVALSYEKNQAINNFAHELATCSAYYSIVGEMKGLPEKDKKNHKDLALMLANASSEITNMDATTARIELSQNEMIKTLDGKAENWSILLNKYGEFCGVVVKDPESRMKYWLEKK